MKKFEINPQPILGFQPDPDFDIILDPTDRTVVTVTYLGLRGDRK